MMMFIKSALKRKSVNSHFVLQLYKNEFDASINKINVFRARVTAITFIILETTTLTISILMGKDDLFGMSKKYYIYLYLVMIFAMFIFWRVFVKLQMNPAKNGKAINLVGLFFTYYILCWCAGISLVDKLHTGQILVYIVAVFYVAVTPIFYPKRLLLIYLPVHTTFLIMLTKLGQTDGIPFGDIINSSAFIAISWAISYMRYYGQVVAFSNRKLIEEKSSDLERMNAELHEANKNLEILSQTDGLTGIQNRAKFDHTIRMEWDRCRRQFAHLSLIMADIDSFKSFNDYYGHLFGDMCIQEVANAISSCVKRSSDSVARYGGEEFAVILPYMESDEAEVLAESIRSRVEGLAIPRPNSFMSEYLTISLGVYSAIPSNKLLIEEFIGNADEALYEAKKRHNAVEVFGMYRNNTEQENVCVIQNFELTQSTFG